MRRSAGPGLILHVKASTGRFRKLAGFDPVSCCDACLCKFVLQDSLYVASLLHGFASRLACEGFEDGTHTSRVSVSASCFGRWQGFSSVGSCPTRGQRGGWKRVSVPSSLSLCRLQWCRGGHRHFLLFCATVCLSPLRHVDPCFKVVHHYIELRREIQSLFVVTSWGRLIHVPSPDGKDSVQKEPCELKLRLQVHSGDATASTGHLSGYSLPGMVWRDVDPIGRLDEVSCWLLLFTEK